MNTINDKQNVAFGLKFTPRAQELLTKEVKQLETSKWIDFGGENRVVKPMETIKYLVNHKESHDLTVDIFESKRRDRPYEYSFSFTKGSKLKRSLKQSDTFLSLSSLVESMQNSKLKSVKQSLKILHSIAKNEVNNSKTLRKLSRDKEVKAKFAEGTSKNIAKLKMEALDLSELIKNTPERFTFKLVEKEFHLASSEYPKAGYKPYGNAYLSSSKEEILDFEKDVLQKAHESVIRLDEAKSVFKTALDEKKGLQFTNEIKRILLNEEDISPEQVAEFTQLANRESSKDLVLHLNQRHDNPQTYDAFIAGKDNGLIESFGYGNPLRIAIKSILARTKSIESFEEKFIQKNLGLKIKQEKDTAIRNLMQTKEFKDKFVEDSSQNIEANFDGLALRTAHLKALVDETPGIKIKIGKRNFDRIPVLVASDKYPKAGFVEIHEYVSSFAINNLSPLILKTFEESTIKPAHFENVKIDKARKQLKNIFAKAEKNSK